MKINPKFLTLCLIVLFSINLISAQSRDNKSKFKDSEKHIERLKAELDLTEIQVNQLDAIETEFTIKVKAARDANTEKGAAKETIKALRADKEEAIKGMLNIEQATKYDALKAEQKDKRGDKGKKGSRSKNTGTSEERAQAHTTRLTEKLALSEEQTMKVAAINLAYSNKRKATKEAVTEKEANKGVMKALRTEQHTAIKAVLTPEQLTAYEAMKDDRKGKGKGTKERRGRK